MSKIKYKFKKNIFKLRRKHRRGHGVHSPYVFTFLTKVIEDRKKNENFKHLNSLRKKNIKNLKNDKSNQYLKRDLKVEIQKLSELKYKAQLIYRMLIFIDAKTAICLEDKSGVSAAYMACSNKDIKINSLNKDKDWDNIASKNWASLGIENISTDKEIDWDESPLFYFSSNMSLKLCLEYYSLIEGSDKFIIVSDIHKTKDINYFWEKLKADPQNTVCIDMYNIGIIIRRDGMQKEDYKFGTRY